MIAPRRRTLARPVELTGRGLHEGLPTLLRLLPAGAGDGIRFVRTDLPGRPEIPALVSHREERPRRTAICAGGAEVHTIEHLLAAVGAAEVTDLTVEIDRVEVPGLDGSSRDFSEALDAAGAADLPGDVPRLVLDRVVEVEDDGARIIALPCPGRLCLEYHLDYGGAIAPAVVRMEVTPPSFRRDLGPARTFCLEREALALQAAGLGRGADTQNTLVIGKDGQPIDNTLRYADECARHKTLDLFGDLMLLGATLEARIIAYRSGHTLNAALARRLRALLEESRAARPASSALAARGHEPREAWAASADAAAPAHGRLLASPVRGARGYVQAGFTPASVVFTGHFPDQPILPGVVSLAALLEAAHALRDEPVRALAAARFRRFVRPGEALSVEANDRGEQVRARMTGADGEVVAEARFGYGTAPG